MECEPLNARFVRVAATLLAAVIVSSATILAAHGQEPVLPGLDAVIGELRQGGLVIYLRHGTTDQSAVTDEEADLAKCETQRNLSVAGRDLASQIGKAVRALGIPIGTVMSSPLCRCKDTATLAFGHYTVNNDLFFALNANAAETKRLTDSLQRMLSTLPAMKNNTVLVSHSANLREAVGIWPKPEGVAYIFRPLPGGRFQAVAKVMPEDWMSAAAKRK